MEHVYFLKTLFSCQNFCDPLVDSYRELLWECRKIALGDKKNAAFKVTLWALFKIALQN
jgi:hypothetical protein